MINKLSFLEMGTKLVKRGPSAKDVNLNVKELRKIGNKIISENGTKTK